MQKTRLFQKVHLLFLPTVHNCTYYSFHFSGPNKAKDSPDNGLEHNLLTLDPKAQLNVSQVWRVSWPIADLYSRWSHFPCRASTWPRAGLDLVQCFLWPLHFARQTPQRALYHKQKEELKEDILAWPQRGSWGRDSSSCSPAPCWNIKVHKVNIETEHFKTSQHTA